MAQVKKGSKVKVFYTGKLKDGTVFESNLGQQPLEFVVGKGKVIKGFEKAVLDMNLGQTQNGHHEAGRRLRSERPGTGGKRGPGPTCPPASPRN